MSERGASEASICRCHPLNSDPDFKPPTAKGLPLTLSEALLQRPKAMPLTSSETLL